MRIREEGKKILFKFFFSFVSFDFFFSLFPFLEREKERGREEERIPFTPPPFFFLGGLGGVEEVDKTSAKFGITLIDVVLFDSSKYCFFITHDEYIFFRSCYPCIKEISFKHDILGIQQSHNNSFVF